MALVYSKQRLFMFFPQNRHNDIVLYVYLLKIIPDLCLISRTALVYKYIICQQKLNSIYSNVIICFILTLFLTLPSQPVLPSPLKLQNFTTPNESLMSVCVQIWHLFHIRDKKIELKLISVCLINEYSLIT